jgi:hypothetical protein
MTGFIFSDMQVSGQVSGMYWFDDKVTQKSKNTSGYQHQRSIGYGSFPVGQQELAIQIASTALTDGEAYKAMALELMASGDEKQIEEKNKELDVILDGGKGETFPIKVVVMLLSVKNAECHFMDHREHTKSDGTTVVDTDQSGFRDCPVTLPLQVVLDGTYTKGKDGNDHLTASFSKSEPVPDGDQCPPIQKSLSASLTMQKKRTK